MCTALKIGSVDKHLGDLIPVEILLCTDNPNPIMEVRWLGHHNVRRRLNVDTQRIAVVRAVSYEEKGTWFDVPKGKNITVVLTETPSFPEEKGAFVLTRPATEDELAECSCIQHPFFLKTQ
jgi:hypothetical protein